MDCSYHSSPRIVITPGSSFCRAGFSSENTPREVIPTVVGTPRYQGAPGVTTWYCGKEAVARRSELDVKHMIEHGIVTNWGDFEKLLHHVFYRELKIAPEEHAFLISEAPIGPKVNRERTTQLIFETFNARALHVKLDMVLSLIGSGRKTGTVCSSGGSKTHIVPIYEGYGLPHAIMRLDMGGDYVTDQLIKLLSTQGYSLNSISDWDSVNKMKEKLAYVAEDYEREVIKTESYSLPDGRVVTLGRERFQCTECLFSPSLVGKESYGIADSIYQSVMKSDIDIRRILLNNLLLSGGNTMLKGMDTRVEKDLAKLVPRHTPVTLLAPPDREGLDWFGGALLASLPEITNNWVTKDEYDESGPPIVHRKCF